MVLRAPGHAGLAEGYCPRPVPNVVFVAPYLLEATLRFVEAAARLPGARVALVGSEPGDAVPAELAAGLATYVRVDDCLDTGQLADGIGEAGRRLGSVDRALSILEDLQVPLAEVRERLGITGMDAGEAANFRDKSRMKDVLRAAGVPCARHGLATQRRRGVGGRRASAGSRSSSSRRPVPVPAARSAPSRRSSSGSGSPSHRPPLEIRR